MDFATILGVIIALGTIIVSFWMEGGRINSIFLTSPMLIVIGGTLGATIITTSLKTLLNAPNYLKIAFSSNKDNFHETIDQIIFLADKARKDGILGLEAELKKIENRFFRKAVQLVIDGTEVTILREVLELEVVNMCERHKTGITFFHKAGGFAPTMGILGTVLGLINTLSNTDDASKMAHSIAAAFIATLWGVGVANIFLLPISDKLKMRHEEEVMHLELITEGVIALQSGENPRSIQIRLLSFINPKHRPIEVY